MKGRFSLSPLSAGSLFAFLASACFGVTTPLIQRAGVGVGPFATAALLYVGAALATTPLGQRAGTEAPLRHRQLPRVLAVALCGAVIAPAALAWGLQRSSATTASLLLNLEAVFTLALSWLVHREPIGRRVGVAAALMLAAGTLLMMRGGAIDAHATWGLGAVGVATLAWAADNTLTRPLSDYDPAHVVRAKALLGAVLSTAFAVVRKEAWPSLPRLEMLLLFGATGYGLSLRLYLLAQRRMGAGRTASVFALAPFLGAFVAWTLGDRAADVWTAIAAVLFGVGAYLHATEEHQHPHSHDGLAHEHAHRHDDGHHDHVHEPRAAGVHSHPHVHEPRVHAHPHGPDLHHHHDHPR